MKGAVPFLLFIAFHGAPVRVWGVLLPRLRTYVCPPPLPPPCTSADMDASAITFSRRSAGVGGEGPVVRYEYSPPGDGWAWALVSACLPAMLSALRGVARLPNFCSRRVAAT